MVVYPPMPHESTSSVFVPNAGQRLARVGLTKPTRAGRLSDASVDPTEARKSQDLRRRNRHLAASLTLA
jgi:hypothetical protein